MPSPERPFAAAPRQDSRTSPVVAQTSFVEDPIAAGRVPRAEARLVPSIVEEAHGPPIEVHLEATNAAARPISQAVEDIKACHRAVLGPEAGG